MSQRTFEFDQRDEPGFTVAQVLVEQCWRCERPVAGYAFYHVRLDVHASTTEVRRVRGAFPPDQGHRAALELQQCATRIPVRTDVVVCLECAENLTLGRLAERGATPPSGPGDALHVDNERGG